MSKTLPVLAGALLLTFSPLFAQATRQDDTKIEAISSINWITKEFVTNISLDTIKADIQMPSGKRVASTYIKSKMLPLIQPPLLSLFENSENDLSEAVINEDLSLDQVYNFIMSGHKTPDVFSKDLKYLNTTNTTNINDIGKLLVRHNYPYNPQKPIEEVPSRAFSGIIIDARGAFPVHGEYVKSEVYACFFPQIWDAQMTSIYEKNIENKSLYLDLLNIVRHFLNMSLAGFATYVIIEARAEKNVPKTIISFLPKRLTSFGTNGIITAIGRYCAIVPRIERFVLQK